MTGKKGQCSGFALMILQDPDRQREIASQGGKACHAPGGRGHQWTRDEARAAGRKGGQANRGKSRTPPREES